MTSAFRRHTSDVEDNARWGRFEFRPGDIVISTRSKSGTTWMQMICALLIFQTPDLPAPLHRLSPWVDWLVVPEDAMYAELAAQTHRRFVKTHVPLDGVPLDPRATYVVVARHPLDAAVSLYHQGANIDRAHVRRLTGQPEPVAESAGVRMPLHEWLLEWIETDVEPYEQLDSLPGHLHHLSDAWARRSHPHVVLVHFDDLADDLEHEMRRLAAVLEIVVPDDTWPVLTRAATFEQMRARPREVAPDPGGVLRNVEAFFRRGRSGAAREVLTDAEYAAYLRRAAALADAEALAWLHRDPPSS
jgi:aryl sulfotransferase